MKTLSFRILGETLVIDEKNAVRLVLENRSGERTEVVIAISNIFLFSDYSPRIVIFSNNRALDGDVLSRYRYTGDNFGFLYSYCSRCIPEWLVANGQRIISAILQPVTLYNISK